jgi:transketolase
MSLAEAPLATGWSERYSGATREVYRRCLTEAAANDPSIFCLDSDTGGLETTFAERLPDQYVNVGIAEANLMGVAAGMAATGLRPYAHTFAGFATARACEQVKVDIAGNALPVRIVATHAGLSAGHYGPTHHAVEDIAIMRTLPSMTIVVPADAVETDYAVQHTLDLPGPLYLRLGRSATPLVYTGPYEFRLGEAVPLQAGSDVTIVATGPWPVLVALDAAAALARRGVSAAVLNRHTVKPIDRAALLHAARQTGGIVTVEDHVLVGGLGAAVCEVVTAEHPCLVRRVGVPDRHLDIVGEETDLLRACGVSAVAVAAAALAIVRAA